jgi:3-dehydrotetronate 4-kinase
MRPGCIADDFTGATDLANTLTRRGMRTILMIGVSKAVSPEAHPIVAIVVPSSHARSLPIKPSL